MIFRDIMATLMVKVDLMAATDYRQCFQSKQSFPMTLGGILPEIGIAYETWGTLNSERSNAVLLFPGLSASAHAKSHDRDDGPGWWEAILNEGHGLDYGKFFIICFDHLGGCSGSTGPASINPESGTPYGPEFPPLMLQDIVAAAHMVVTGLGIEKAYCALGASMGGMLALEYAARYPESLERMIMISASGRPGAQSIAYRYVQRQVILADPFYHDGWYYDQPTKPLKSLAVARQIGNITYRSTQEFRERFGRSRTLNGYNFGPDFQVESYLHHMGSKLADNFDANSFLFLSKAMDLYSLGYGFPSYEKGVARIKAKSLIISISSDCLFPAEEQKEVYDILEQAGRDVAYRVLESPSGHDAFLVEVDFFERVIHDFLAKS